MPSIAIIGAGPAGLTLARLLMVQAREQNLTNLQLAIFEHDASATARWQQGGTLDLHTETGIAALKAAHMWDDILPHMRYEGEELIFADMNATKYLHLKGSPPDSQKGRIDYERPEVDREVLKQYLLKAVEDFDGKTRVTWDKHLLSVDGETGLLKFRDGSEAGPFDLVVGADGAWSKVRSVVTDVKPTYSGICGFEAWIDQEHSGDQWEKFTNLVGQGSFFSYSQKKSMMAQRMEDGTMKTSMWSKREHTWPADVWERAGGDSEKIKAALLSEFSGWDSQLTDLIRCSYHFRQWPLYELPIGHSWDHKKGFTLIGDSAHLMTPFAGEGVNAAMKDALELAKAILSGAESEQSLDEAVRKYELDLFPRNAKVQSQTARNKNLMFTENAPIEFMARSPEMFAAEHGYDTTKGWLSGALIPVIAILYSVFWSLSKYGYVRRLLRRT